MRFAIAILSVCCLFASGAQAGDRPLYNSSGSGGSALYNGAGSGGVKPLSLRQIIEGRSTAGSSGYSYKGTGYKPHGSGSSDSGSFTMADVADYRARQAAQAQKQEREAKESFVSYGTDEVAQDKEKQGYLNRFKDGSAEPDARQSSKKKRVLYKGRDRNIETPRRIFNSLR